MSASEYHLLWISVIGAAPFIITMHFTTLGVWASNGISEQHASNHTGHHHDKDRQDFQETGQNGTSFGLDVVFGTKNSLNNNLKF